MTTFFQHVASAYYGDPTMASYIELCMKNALKTNPELKDTTVPECLSSLLNIYLVLYEFDPETHNMVAQHYGDPIGAYKSIYIMADDDGVLVPLATDGGKN
jgi:hypothetical protein